MSFQALLQQLFHYRAWANDELLAGMGRLDPGRHGAELDAAVRLLNHCYVVDRIFAAHLQGVPHPFPADNTAEMPALDSLRDGLATSGRWYLGYVGSVTQQALAESVPFTFTDGDEGCMSRGEMLLHVVTHGGYHRGEVGRILVQAGITPPWDTFAVFLHRTEPSRRLQGAKSKAR